MSRRALLPVIVAVLAAGCQSRPGDSPGAGFGPAEAESRPAGGSSGQVLGYLGSEAITAGQLMPSLLEVGGGAVLSEFILDTMLRKRLTATGEPAIGPDRIDQERQYLAQTLADDPDQAARLLAEVRQLRGLGPVRFEALLWRNAALRRLVSDKVQVTEPAVRQEYRLSYGGSARVRLLMQSTLGEIQATRREIVDGGQAFGELAALRSIDPSAAQGGLLSPIRPDDSSYPQSLREVASQLEVGQVSEPIALDGGFALLKLDARLPGSEVSFEEVRGSLEQAVRLRAERVLMQQLARELTGSAEVVVLDPSLNAAWQNQRRSLLESP